MKKILVTGAAGMVGFHVLEYLIHERNYEITALDLKSNSAVKKLKKLGKQINVVYGDISDESLINSLVKTHDYIIHLASVLPPLADIKPELTRIVNFEGTKNIVNAIKKYNPKCFLLFSSSISVYGDRLDNYQIKVGDKVGANEFDYYANFKIKTENYIRKEIKNYSIFRLTAIMGRPGVDPLMFHMPLKTKLEICSDLDTALAFAKAIEHKKELNRKTFNLSGGIKCRTTYREFLVRMFKIYGISLRSLQSMVFAEKNFHCGYYEDGDKLEKILKFRRDTLETYFKRVDSQTKKINRFFAKIFSKPIVYFLNKKSEPLKAIKNKDKHLLDRFFNKR